MKENLGRVKLIAFLAILSLIFLVGIVIVQLISIHENQKIILTQQAEIEELNNQLNYYENTNQDLSNGNEIIIGEE